MNLIFSQWSELGAPCEWNGLIPILHSLWCSSGLSVVVSPCDGPHPFGAPVQTLALTSCPIIP